MYKLLSISDSILRTSDGANIPPDIYNVDYQAFLRWLAEGNTPTPADPPELNPRWDELQRSLMLSNPIYPRIESEALADPTVMLFLNQISINISSVRLTSQLSTRIKQISDYLISKNTPLTTTEKDWWNERMVALEFPSDCQL
jgi:hypothetical protein